MSSTPPGGIYDTRYLLFQPFQCPCASLFNIPVLGAKASAKIQPFSIPPKFFFVFFRRFSSNGWTTGRYGRKNFYSEAPQSRTQAAKTAPRGTKNPKNRQKTHKNSKNAFFSLCHSRLSPFQTPKTANLSTSRRRQPAPHGRNQRRNPTPKAASRPSGRHPAAAPQPPWRTPTTTLQPPWRPPTTTPQPHRQAAPGRKPPKTTHATP